MTMRYDGTRRGSTWNSRRGRRAVQALVCALLLFALTGFPPVSQAQEAVTYTWTAPTSGGTPAGYQVQRNLGNGVWVVAADSIATRSFTYTQPAGSSEQIRVAGIWRGSEPVMVGELIVATRYLRIIGPWSQNSLPYTPPVQTGGCGRPVRQ